MPANKETTLHAHWSKRENDIMIYYPNGASGHLLHQVLSTPKLWVLPKDSGGDMKPLYGITENPYLAVFEDKSFLQELESRGYDLTTFRFSIRKKGTVK